MSCGLSGCVLEDQQLADAAAWKDRLAIAAVVVAVALAGDLAEEMIEAHSRLALRSASLTAPCTASHGVLSRAAPVALVGECSIPVT
jgi:hypothetical protein